MHLVIKPKLNGNFYDVCVILNTRQDDILVGALTPLRMALEVTLRSRTGVAAVGTGTVPTTGTVSNGMDTNAADSRDARRRYIQIHVSPMGRICTQFHG